MSKKYLCVLVSVLLLGSLNVFAVDCEKATTTVDLNECASITFKEADKRLNATYNKIYKSLNDQEKKILKDSQNAWIKYRDTNAELMVLPYLRASMHTMVYLGAKTELTDTRIEELESITSENLK